MKNKILLYMTALGVAILMPQVAVADGHYAKQLANPIADPLSLRTAFISETCFARINNWLIVMSSL